MSQNGTRYSEEFKQQIVVYHFGRPILELSREYGAETVTIHI